MCEHAVVDGAQSELFDDRGSDDGWTVELPSVAAIGAGESPGVVERDDWSGAAPSLEDELHRRRAVGDGEAAVDGHEVRSAAASGSIDRERLTGEKVPASGRRALDAIDVLDQVGRSEDGPHAFIVTAGRVRERWTAGEFGRR